MPGRSSSTVLAYHVLHAIRFKLGKRGITQSWSTIRKGLSTHMRITATMKRDDGKMIHIRKSTRSEPFHVQIYDALNPRENDQDRFVKVINM
jgi:hypothetical protein